MRVTVFSKARCSSGFAVAAGTGKSMIFFVNVATVFAAILLWRYGLLRLMVVSDRTYLSSVIALIYHNAVPRTQPWHSVLPGATLATCMWFVVTILFGWYLQNYADYNVIYGSLGVAIALLVWMYLISLVILIGAELNAMIFPRSVLRNGLTDRVKNAAYFS